MPPQPVVLPAAGRTETVVVPGLGLTASSYRGLVDELGAALPTAVVALPALGLGAAPGDTLDPESLADDLARRLTEHGLLADGPLVLVGHSASCQVVAELGRRHPHAVRGLVLVGPTADPRMSPRRRLVARWLRTVVWEDPRRVPGMLRAYATTRLSGFARGLRAARRRDLRATLAATAVPVLIVRGPRDHLAPSGWLAALAATRPGIEVATVPHGAHNVPLTHPAALARHVVTLARRVCRDASTG
ncbi:pimeloyl-ACP methyl ester carboxylesterase [Actinomycetospora succinea]|uniref:Pimeloyl-ACP methyl ester carboxylesterase n=1 Tax=Actinomycetospora succinea TaxID=663603 RepID=A0A4R6V9F8_9PSEU|nr:alpha/beta hydrolase [Actinomycetospora succinea]TDQ55856.1 pimeloyl-ACP methyl ester carboxylesterase [Actinomycetospora succinea]